MFKLLNTDAKAYTFITIIGALLFIPFIGNMPLFDWDEINFAECAREMIASNDYSNVQLYFHPFWEKPPLFIWLQAISMNIFGVNEFAARLPNAICGIATLLTLYNIGKKLNDYQFGLIWVFVYAASLLPHLFFKSGIIDPWFNLFIFASVYQLIQHTNNPVGTHGYKTAIFAGFFLGLALLTKGPAALILAGLTTVVFFILNRLKKISQLKFILVFFIVFIFTGMSWFIIELIKGNGNVIIDFIEYQIRLFKTEDSDHGGPFIYHFVVLLLGCFPASIFLMFGHKKSNNDTPFQVHSKKWMLSLFWVVLILFSIVQTKIVHYSSLCYFPLTYIAVYSIRKIISREFEWRKWVTTSILIISSVLGVLFIILGSTPFIKDWLISSNLIADQFALENLKANVEWSKFEWIIGLLFISITLWALTKILKKQFQYIYLIFVASFFLVYSLIMVFIPKIEQYTQRAAIEFYRQCAKHNFSVETIGYKSYGVLFYGELEPTFKNDTSFINYLNVTRNDYEKQNFDVDRSYGLIRSNWMKNVQTSKPSCFVAKITDEDVVKKYCPYLKELYRKNGYIFYIRIFNHQYKTWDFQYNN